MGDLAAIGIHGVGGDIPALLAAVREREGAKTSLRVQIDALRGPAIDPVELKADLPERLADWRGLLTRHISAGAPDPAQVAYVGDHADANRAGKAPPLRVHLEASLAKLLGANMVASPPGFE
jgi:hypothetical protein